MRATFASVIYKGAQKETCHWRARGEKYTIILDSGVVSLYFFRGIREIRRVYSLHPKNERDDIVCEVLPIAKGFEFLGLCVRFDPIALSGL